jgi:hypothetical protein
MNGREKGVYVRTASDHDDTDPSVDGKCSDEKAIVEIAPIQWPRKVLKFELRSDFTLNSLRLSAFISKTVRNEGGRKRAQCE